MEDGFVKMPRLRIKALARVPLEEMAEILKGAGYLVKASV